MPNLLMLCHHEVTNAMLQPALATLHTSRDTRGRRDVEQQSNSTRGRMDRRSVLQGCCCACLTHTSSAIQMLSSSYPNMCSARLCIRCLLARSTYDCHKGFYALPLIRCPRCRIIW